MKTKYFLGVAALLAAATSCTDDQLVEIAENGELQGAELVSKGLSIQLTKNDGEDTRLDASGWQNGDQAGLVWATTGNLDITAVQDRTKTPYPGATAADNKVGANNLFVYNNGEFNTVSNIYRGWAFGYYPYAYQEVADVIKFNTVNSKVQEEAFDKDRYNSAYVSDRLFLSAKDEGTCVGGVWQYPHNVNKAEGTLVEGTTLSLKRIVNILKFELAEQDAIKNNEVLKKLGIKSLKASITNTFFNQTITVNPAALPVVGATGVNYSTLYAKDADYAANKTTKAFIGSGAETSVTTTFKEGLFTLAADATARMFVAPVEASTLTAENEPVYEVEVPGGKFVINSTSTAEANPIAVTKLARLMNGQYIKENDGLATTDPKYLNPALPANASKVRSLQYVYDAAGKLQAAQTINLVLDPKDFVLDPKPCVKSDAELSELLTSYAEWAKIGVKPATVVVYLDGNASGQFEISKATIEQANALYTASLASGYPIQFTIENNCGLAGHNPTTILVQKDTEKIMAVDALTTSVKVGMKKAGWALNDDALFAQYTDVINYGTMNASGLTATTGKFNTPIENQGTANFTGTNLVNVVYNQTAGTTNVSGTTTMNSATITAGNAAIAAGAKYLTTTGSIAISAGVKVNNSGKFATQGTGTGQITNLGEITSNEGSETYIYSNQSGATVGRIYLAKRDTKVSVAQYDNPTLDGLIIYKWGQDAKDTETYAKVITDRFNAIEVTSNAKPLSKITADLIGLIFDKGVDQAWYGNAINTIEYMEVAGSVNVQKGYSLLITSESVITGEVNVGGTYQYGASTSATSQANIYNNGGTVMP